MRSSSSGPLLARAAAVGLLLSTALSVFACGSDAVGIEACRRIEKFRCKSAIYCFSDWDQSDVDACEAFYEDECLHGIANDSEDAPAKASIDACIDAINTTVACKQAKVTTMEGCPQVALVDGTAASTVETCAPIVSRPEVLKACSFLVKPPETTTSSSSGAGGGGGAGGGT